tara:strand:+ start:1302 stop:2045 length:744 start_codon:yes stop_codon:yes gene_type:complete
MSKVEKHPTDEGKYQSTFDEYGHGIGNGKSRAAVYKHYAKTNDSVKVEKEPKVAAKKNRDTESLSDFTKSAKTETEGEDFTKSAIYDEISWLDNETETVGSTIPSPIRRIASGKGPGLSAAQLATQTHLVRWGYMGLDRGITHWGREVMNRPEWELQRSNADYDALEGATTNLMDSYGVHIQLSPGLVWGTVMAAAYVPPVAHITRNADPSTREKLGLWVRTVLLRPSRWFRRRNRGVVASVSEIND